MKNKSIVNNSIWAISQQLFSLILSFAIGVITVRYLGAEKYGVIGIANAITLIVFSFSWLGIDSVIVNEIIVSGNKEFDVVWTVLITKFITSFFSIFIAAAVGFFSNDNAEIFVIIVILSGLAMFLQSYEIFSYWFQSKLLIKYVAIAVLISQTSSSIIQIIFILFHKSLIYFAIIPVIQNALLFSILFISFKSISKSKITFNIGILKKILKKSFNYVISSIAITLYMQIDKVMIGKMISDSESGVYNVAVNLALYWQIIPISIINSMRPVILYFKKEKDEKYLDYLKVLVFVVSVISFVICIILCLFSSQIINFLYGENFEGAVIPFIITVWATFVAMIGVIRGIWLIAEGLDRYDKYFTIAAAIINIILNIFLIRFMGIIGAALATLISYFVEVFVVNLLFKRTQYFDFIFLSSFFNLKNKLSICKTMLKERKLLK